MCVQIISSSVEVVERLTSWKELVTWLTVRTP